MILTASWNEITQANSGLWAFFNFKACACDVVVLHSLYHLSANIEQGKKASQWIIKINSWNLQMLLGAIF
jgi:hypothetical protein